MLPIFVHWLHILQICWIYLLILISLCSIWNYLICMSCHLQIVTNLHIPPQLAYPLLLCLIPLARTSSIVLNKNFDNGHLSFIPYLEAFSFSPFQMVVAVGFIFMEFIMLNYCLNFVKVFVFSLKDFERFFFLINWSKLAFKFIDLRAERQKACPHVFVHSSGSCCFQGCAR